MHDFKDFQMKTYLFFCEISEEDYYLISKSIILMAFFPFENYMLIINNYKMENLEKELMKI